MQQGFSCEKAAAQLELRSFCALLSIPPSLAHAHFHLLSSSLSLVRWYLVLSHLQQLFKLLERVGKDGKNLSTEVEDPDGGREGGTKSLSFLELLGAYHNSNSKCKLLKRSTAVCCHFDLSP